MWNTLLGVILVINYIYPHTVDYIALIDAFEVLANILLGEFFAAIIVTLFDAIFFCEVVVRNQAIATTDLRVRLEYRCLVLPALIFAQLLVRIDHVWTVVS